MAEAITTKTVDPEALTPAMKQFIGIREKLASQHPNVLLLYRMGDFYETFFEDAVEINRLLGLTLTCRNKGKGGVIPMAGVPMATLDSYLARLVKSGKSVGIVEQFGDPAETKGTMERRLVRVVTPGTITETELLPAKSDAVLLSVCPPRQKKDGLWAVVSLVLSNGAFHAVLCEENALPAEIARREPREILAPDSIREKIIRIAGAAQVTPLPDWHFDAEHGTETLCHHFGMQNLDAWAVSEKPSVLAAAGAVLGYVEDTQVDAVPHIRPLVLEDTGSFLGLDPASRRNLELTASIRNDCGPTLFSTLDHCRTPMGSRMLRNWITQPLRDHAEPARRQEATGELIGDGALSEAVSEGLSSLPDLERIASRIALGSVKPRELAGLRDAMPKIASLAAASASALSPCLGEKAAKLSLDPALGELLVKALLPEPAVTLRDGAVIADTFSEELKELRELRDNAGSVLARIEEKEKRETGIQTLRVEYNRNAGYFIEVPKGAADKVPASYVRRQTLKNSERFITPELKTWEDKALAARERSLTLERTLYAELVTRCAAYVEALTEASEAAASLDALLSFAEHARASDWVKPELSDSAGVTIRGARHPVVEKALEHYVANDCELVPGRRTLIITGPNMGGKSTYMRSIALIVILALAGSWVPAESARIGSIDRILTRIGASDDLARGLSTFMVEMVEAAAILHQATDHSLVLMDEIGRGTSTFDGLSLAGAIARELSDKIRSYTLFATHYFELTQLSQTCAEVANVHVCAAQSARKVVFLHEVKEGPANQSYGIAVAQLAGVPRSVIASAKKMLSELEERAKKAGPEPDLFSAAAAPEPEEDNFEDEAQEDPRAEAAISLLGELSRLDPDSMTPRDALQTLYQIIGRAKAAENLLQG